MCIKRFTCSCSTLVGGSLRFLSLCIQMKELARHFGGQMLPICSVGRGERDGVEYWTQTHFLTFILFNRILVSLIISLFDSPVFQLAACELLIRNDLASSGMYLFWDSTSQLLLGSIPSIRELTTPGVIHFKLSDPSSLSQDYIEVFKALWTL